MKKSRYYPYERNRYFYGKLLTVRDFESEQKYFNDKRRLLNRLVHGSGVVSGMQVVAVDDKTISVEMGVALDYAGREIVIPSPVTLKLSMIEGFTNNEYAKNVYLCVAYDEKGKEPVHSIANSTVRSEEVSEHNRILESYKLFVKEQAPDPASFEFNELTDNVTMLYEDGHVRIYQRAPKYVNPEQIFDVTLVVEKTLQTPPIRLAYEIESESFIPMGGGSHKIEFNEPVSGQETEYVLKYYLKAGNRENAKATLDILRESVELCIGDNKIVLEANPSNQIEIVSGSIKERVLNNYFSRTLDRAVEGYADQQIVLAKISLLQVGPTYMIEKVENVPFGEYIYSSSMLYRLGLIDSASATNRFFAKASTYALHHNEEAQLSVDYDIERSEFDFRLGVPQPKPLSDDMASGIVTLNLDKYTKSALQFLFRGEKSYVTDEINHGLGIGNTYIMVGLEEHEDDMFSGMLDVNDKVYYGSSDVFKDTQFETKLPHVSFGTIVYPGKGTFRIGMKLHSATEARTIKIRWWAFRKDSVVGSMLFSSTLEAAVGKEDAEGKE